METETFKKKKKALKIQLMILMNGINITTLCDSTISNDAFDD